MQRDRHDQIDRGDRGLPAWIAVGGDQIAGQRFGQLRAVVVFEGVDCLAKGRLMKG